MQNTQRKMRRGIRPIRIAAVFFFLLLISSALQAVAAEISASSAAKNPSIEATIAEYPDRLNLGYVLQAAEKHASLFKSLRATESVIRTPLMSARGPYAPHLTLGVRRFNDRNEPSNPFSPNRINGTTSFAGFEQGIAWTGTQFSFEVQHGNTSLSFPTIAISPYFETRASLSVRQSILQSLVYGVDRERIRAAEENVLANTYAFQQERDQATRVMINLFYQAWLAQTEVRAAQTNLQNKQDLLDITRLRLRRGTAERPDLLQVQSGVQNAQIQLDRATRVLGDIWRNLIVTLELPKELLAYDPMKVPVDLDQPVPVAEARCREYQPQNPEGPMTLRQAAALARAKSAESRAKSLAMSTGPDLVFTGNGVTNAIDTNSRGETFRSTAQGDYPAWSLELAARIPLGATVVKAESAVATANAIRAAAEAEQEFKGAGIERMNRCLNLAQLISARKLAEKILEAQTDRLQLEKARFRIGRSNLTQVVIAADERLLADRSLRAAEVNERDAAWQVNELEGSLQEIALGRPLRTVEAVTPMNPPPEWKPIEPSGTVSPAKGAR